jgi:hypothetical protein
VQPRDIRAYLDRDWKWIARAKDEYWAERKRRLGLGEVLRVMSDLREHARALRPEWPTPEERAEDLQVHERVAEALSKVTSPRFSGGGGPRGVR